MLRGATAIPVGATYIDKDGEFSQISMLLQEQDMFGDHKTFDIEYNLDDLSDAELAILDAILAQTTHDIWWFSSKKPKLNTKFNWLEAEKPRLAYNIFDFVDLVVAKNKKDAWLYYQQHLINQEIQEIIPSVLWGIKSLFNVAMNETGEMSPFVVNKMKKNLALWTPETILIKQYDLIKIYEGEIEGDNAHRLFEKFLLTL